MLRARLGWLLAVPAIWHVVAFGLIVASRIPFPFDIDWIEGTALYEAHRVLHHEALYVAAPVGGYVPAPYPPLYFAAVAWVGALFGGVSHGVGRAVSAGSLTLALVLASASVRSHARDRGIGEPLASVIALSALGISLSANTLLGGYFDIARPDALATALALIATVLATRATPRGAWLAALAMTLALYTKQTCIFPAVGLLAALAIERRALGVHFASALATFGSAGLVLMHHVSRGSFLPWLFTTRHHMIRAGRFVDGTERALLWVPFLLVALAVAPHLHRRVGQRARTWLLTSASILPVTLLAYAKDWGFVNNFLMLVAFAGPAATFAAIDFFPRRALGVALAQAALLVGRMYVGDFFRPQLSERHKAETLVAEVGSLPGDVLSPIDPFLAVEAGHVSAQAPLLTYLDAANARVFDGGVDGYVAMIEQRKPEWILLTGHPEERGLMPMMARDYVFDRDLPAPTPGAVVLMFSVPNRLYRRR